MPGDTGDWLSRGHDPLSEVTDLPLVILEKTRHAAEAAAASARLLESQAGTRLAAVEIRLNAIDLLE